MTKKLLTENLQGIQAWKAYCNELVYDLNIVLTRFKSEHNHFNQPIEEKFAYSLVSNPLEVWDDLLRINSPIKAVAGGVLDISRLADLVGLNRQAWINAITMTLPGTKDQYNKSGRKGILQLSAINRPLIAWHDDRFVLNEKEVEKGCDKFRTYAEGPEALAELDHYLQLAEALSNHLKRPPAKSDGLKFGQRQYLDAPSCHLLALKLGLQYDNSGKFTPDYELLKRIIKTLTLVN